MASMPVRLSAFSFLEQISETHGGDFLYIHDCIHIICVTYTLGGVDVPFVVMPFDLLF